MNNALHEHVAENLLALDDPVLRAFVDQLKRHYGQSIYAIVFYGSCLRSREYSDAMLDFYVIVNDYETAYENFWERLVIECLPPNVYCLNAHYEHKQYIAKYAVISKHALERAVSERALHSYFWARFSQPIAHIYLAEAQARDFLIALQATAVTTFMSKVAPLTDASTTAQMFWVRGFEYTYAAELRAEGKLRAQTIFATHRAFYTRISELNSIHSKSQSKRLARGMWQVRIVMGKLLSVLRLLKAATTFINGVDYIAWKIHRHTGEQLTVTPRLRKYPWLFAWPILIKLLLKRTIK